MTCSSRVLRSSHIQQKPHLQQNTFIIHNKIPLIQQITSKDLIYNKNGQILHHSLEKYGKGVTKKSGSFPSKLDNYKNKKELRVLNLQTVFYTCYTFCSNHNFLFELRAETGRSRNLILPNEI